MNENMLERTVKPKVIIVEDSRLVAEDLAEMVENLGCQVCGIAGNADLAYTAVRATNPDLILMDICIQGDKDGIEAAATIRQATGKSVIFLTAYSNDVVLERAKKVEPLGYIIKPFNEKTLRATLEIAIVKARTQGTLQAEVRLKSRELRQTRCQLEQKSAENAELSSKLFQSQKLEIVGQLSSGIAHDFNNMLMPIMGYSESIASGDGTQEEITEWANAILESARSGAQLTRQLLNISRRQLTIKKPIYIDEVITRTACMLKRIIGEDIQFTEKLAEGLPPIEADNSQLQQILLNLVVNARDAMPDGGSISIRTSKCEMNDKRPGILLEVRDSGAGISKELQQQIFDPFFSTKGKSGSGLGLSVVRGIVETHDGELELKSEVGVGSTFRISIPATEHIPEAIPDSSAPQSHQKSDDTDHKILLIEDEQLVAKYIEAVLEKEGHRVTHCACLTEAMEKLTASEQEFDLILADTVLPDGSGLDLLRRVSITHPETRQILSTGYVQDLNIAQEGAATYRFLPKPYTPDQLIDEIDAAFNDPVSLLS